MSIAFFKRWRSRASRCAVAGYVPQDQNLKAESGGAEGAAKFIKEMALLEEEIAVGNEGCEELPGSQKIGTGSLGVGIEH